MNLQYQEFPPSPSLERIVDSYWYFHSDHPEGSFEPLKHCPHGMVEMIIHLGHTPTEGLINNRWIQFPGAYIMGIQEKQVIWQVGDKTGLFGIRLRPEIIFQLFKLPSKDIINSFVPIDWLVDNRVTEVAKNMQDAQDNQTRILLIEAFLMSQVPRFESLDSYFESAMDIIRSSEVPYSVDDLCRALFISERQLQRAFKKSLGLGPKTYIKISRFRKVYQVLRSQSKISSYDIVFNFGYADHAHFIRDFKAFSGETPSNFLSGKSSSICRYDKIKSVRCDLSSDASSEL